MNTTSPTVRIVCDFCGKFSAVSPAMVTVGFGDGDPIHFCDAECFASCCAQGGRLVFGRQLLIAFGRSMREHWDGILDAVREGARREADDLTDDVNDEGADE